MTKSPLDKAGPAGKLFVEVLKDKKFAPFLKLISSTPLYEYDEIEDEGVWGPSYEFQAEGRDDFFTRFAKYGNHRLYLTREEFDEDGESFYVTEFGWEILPYLDVSKLDESIVFPELPGMCFENDDWDAGGREWLSELAHAHIVQQSSPLIPNNS